MYHYQAMMLTFS